MTKNSSARHLKLVTGEEIICEVLDESPDSIVVNNAMALTQNTMKTGEKFFTFKTYMIYQDTPMNCILVFTDKIMSLAIPTQEMVAQYDRALVEMAHYIEESLDDDMEDDLSLNEFLDEMKKESKSKEMLDSDTDGMLMN